MWRGLKTNGNDESTLRAPYCLTASFPWGVFLTLTVTLAAKARSDWTLRSEWELLSPSNRFEKLRETKSIVKVRQGEKGVCDFSIMCVGSIMSCLMIIYSIWRSILSEIWPMIWHALSGTHTLCSYLRLTLCRPVNTHMRVLHVSIVNLMQEKINSLYFLRVGHRLRAAVRLWRLTEGAAENFHQQVHPFEGRHEG